MTFLVKLHKTNKMPKSTIKGLGFYVPENIVTNDDLTKIMDTSDEWIKERTGIKERRWFNDIFFQSVIQDWIKMILIL